MKRKQLAILMAAMLCSRGLQAADTPSTYVGDEIVVSATRTLNRISDAGGSSVTVITAEEIKNSGQSTVAGVIKGTVGIDVVSTGSLGATTSVFMRGADSKNTLLMIDGVASNDPSSMNRNPIFENWTVDNIERIEIVRGPVSALYGSNATAGVINIITRKGGSTPEAYAGAEGGSYGTYKLYGGARGRKGIIDYSFGVARLKNDGFSSIDEKNRSVNPTGQVYEKDGYENTTLSGSIGVKLSERLRLETVLRHTSSDLDYDVSSGNDYHHSQHSENMNGRVALKYDLQPLQTTLYYNVNSQNRDYLRDGTAASRFHGYLYELGWQEDMALSKNNKVSAGVNVQNESLRNTDLDYHTYLEKEISSVSLFLQDQWRIGGLNIVGSIRNDNHETFGDKTTYRIAPSFTLGGTVLKFSYGTGYRAPSLYELYDPTYGNSSLKPETSKGWDAGFERQFSETVKFGSTYFRTLYEDRIDWVSDGTAWGGYYDQVAGKTECRGVESFIEWKPAKKLFLVANHTYTFTQNALGQELLRRPRNKVGLSATLKASDKVKLNMNMQWVASHWDNDFSWPVNRLKLGSYTLVNVGASYKVEKSVELYGRIDNIFNEYYENAWGYSTPGRSAYAGVKVGF